MPARLDPKKRKKKTMISISPDIYKFIKDNNINLSGQIDRLMRLQMKNGVLSENLEK